MTHVSRRTGRAELDEHAENVNVSEIDVGLLESDRPKPGLLFAVLRGVPGLHGFGVEQVGRERNRVGRVRDRLPKCPACCAILVSQFRIGWTISCPAFVHRLP